MATPWYIYIYLSSLLDLVNIYGYLEIIVLFYVASSIYVYHILINFHFFLIFSVCFCDCISRIITMVTHIHKRGLYSLINPCLLINMWCQLYSFITDSNNIHKIIQKINYHKLEGSMSCICSYRKVAQIFASRRGKAENTTKLK